MNITPQAPNLSIPTVLNPHTESLRRDNNQREIITQPAPSHQSAAEKGVASDRERSRTPAQNNAYIDFVSIKEQAELANSTITGQNKDTGQNKEQSDQSHHHAHDGHEGEDAQESSVNNATVSSQSTSISEEGDTNTQTIEQERVISELKKTDLEVRAHEAAHAAVGGSVTGSPTFSYQNSPNGQRYAVAGEVSVDLSPVSGDPRATIAKMQKVHAAALAPINPSSQDKRVANTATQIILQAQSELLSEMNAERDEAQASNNSKTSEAPSVSDSLTVSDTHSTSSGYSDVIVKRALRIENFYADITHAYEKAPSYNFELTA